MTFRLDLIIMGGYYGSGRRGRGEISHFLLGLAAPSPEGETGLPAEFYSLCRVGSGYNYRDLLGLMQKIQPHFKRGRPAADFAFKMHFGKEKPDVWLDPSKSVLLEVKAAEITPTDVYKAGYTLRYANEVSEGSLPANIVEDSTEGAKTLAFRRSSRGPLAPLGRRSPEGDPLLLLTHLVLATVCA